MSHPDAGALTAQILASRKYVHLDPDLVRRVVLRCLDKGGEPAVAARRARRALHQLYGAFLGYRAYREVEVLLGTLEDPAARALDPDTHRLFCTRVLGCHASTSERLPYAKRMYGAVRDFLGSAPCRLLDLGCGLNPFALPWMELAAGTTYQAVDVDRRLADLVTRYFGLVGLSGRGMTADLASGPPPGGPWDAALLLKLVPTLERQAEGSSGRLIRGLRTERLVISYARASLGGRRKGMDDQYAQDQEKLAADCGLECRMLVFPAETVFLCVRRGGALEPPV